MKISRSHKLASWLAAAVFGLSLPASAATVNIWTVDFDGVNVSYPAISGSLGPYVPEAALGGPYNGSNGKSWSGIHATVFDTNVLTLSIGNLPVHSQISIDFLLGFLNSWDSTNGSPAPDILSITIDGGAPVQLTTVIASGTVNQHQGGTLLVDNGQIDQNQFFADDLVDMGTAGFLTFAHSAPTLTMTIQAGGAGWQGGRDEYWGLDALKVSAVVPDNGVPEPQVPALLAAGLLAAGLQRLGARRRGVKRS